MLLSGDAMTIDTSVARSVAKQCLYLAGPGVILYIYIYIYIIHLSLSLYIFIYIYIYICIGADQHAPHGHLPLGLPALRLVLHALPHGRLHTQYSII